MFVSYKWLKKYAALPENLSPRELANRLTLATVEVEGVEEAGDGLDSVVVGIIIAVEPHPDADKLKIAQVDIGGKTVQIVCGGTNLRAEMRVAVALPGARVRWHGEGEPVELAPVKLRGVESFGMICAAVELSLTEKLPSEGDHEISDLSFLTVPAGTPLAEALDLNDSIIEIENKSLTNRPDLWGHYGLAREAAALYGVKFADYSVHEPKSGSDWKLKVSVEDVADCPRYCAMVVTGVKVGPSPDWLKDGLVAIGQKSINNIVDITNYLMFDLGQPLHAFDATKLSKKELAVRRAIAGETLRTLDGEVRELSGEDLVIADASKPVALAGIMGGAETEITAETTTIVFEAANFDPFLTRKTAARHNLRTEAAVRFEKSLDPRLAETALFKAVELLLRVCPEATPVSAFVDKKKALTKPPVIKLSWKFIHDRIGETLDEKRIMEILKSLGFDLKNSATGLTVTVPSWRATKDIAIKEDIIEEITRVYGYDNISPVMPASTLACVEFNPLRRLEREVKNFLTLAAGADEVYQYSFASAAWLKKLGQSPDHVELLNPWDEDWRYLRRSLVPGLLKTAGENLRFAETCSLFEVGKTFINDGRGEPITDSGSERLPTQDTQVAGVLTVKNSEEDVFLAVKGVVEAMSRRFGWQLEFRLLDNPLSWQHPRRGLTIWCGEEAIGVVACLHPAIGREIDLPETTAFWQLNLSKLVAVYSEEKKYVPVSKYPAVELDLSVIVEEEVEWKTLKTLAKSANAGLIKEVILLDVFRNDKIKAGYKSVTFRVAYQADDRTLSLDEATKIQDSIAANLAKALRAEIRQ